MRRSAALVGLLLASLVACDDSEGGLRNEQFPDLRAEPDELVFAVVPVGETTTKTVVLRNAGGERIQITAIELSNSLDSREFQLEHTELPTIIGSSSGGDADGGAGSDRITVRVNYSPRDEGTDQGLITIRSSAAELTVPVSTIESDAELIINPDRLVFQAEDQEPETKEVSLQNLGNVPVKVTNVFLDEGTSADFSIVNADELPLIEQGDQHNVGVTYTPRDYNGAEGTLIIETDDDVYGRIPIPLRGELPSPEIVVAPDAIVFPATELGEDSEPIELFIENQGTAALVIDDIAFGVAPGNTNEQFRVDLPDLPAEVPPGETISFPIVYAPRDGEVHDTSLAIHSNDVDEQLVTVPVRGRIKRQCLEVSLDEMRFGAVALGVESARRPLRITNCGDVVQNVTALNLVGEGFHMEVDGDDPPRVLQPLDSMDLTVWFANEGLAEGAPAEGTLTVVNDTRETPEIEVALSAVGGGAPTCDLVALDNRVNFGLVSRNSDRTRTATIINTGTGHCDGVAEMIRNAFELPLPGFNEVRFILTGPIGRQRVAPGQEVQVEFVFRPQAFLSYRSIYTLTYDDPFGGMQKQLTIELIGIGGESGIHVIPGHLDFGHVTAAECASREERITVYNTGIVDLCITDIRLEGDCDEFIIVERPVANADGCILVDRRHPAEMRMVYEPNNLGRDECELVFISDADNNQELRVPLEGEGVRERRQTDVFEQVSGRKVDVLFVVDNSGSMGEEQANLAANFGDFIRGAQQFENDYQLGVVSTDVMNEAQNGKLQPPGVMARGPNVEQQFRDAVDLGTNGAGEEHGLEAAQKALSDPLAFDTGVMCGGDGDCQEPDTCVRGVCGGHNRGFLREDAALEVVFVSDEEDQSVATLDFYVDFLKSIKGFRNEALMHAHAIVGAVDGRAAQCQSEDGDAAAGRRYVDVANRTNGQVFSICDDDFGRSLRDIGNQAFGLPVQFFLSRPAVGATIEVTVDGQRQNAGWMYDQPTNSVIFDENHVPQPGQTISVTYEAQCFPRRGG